LYNFKTRFNIILMMILTQEK